MKLPNGFGTVYRLQGNRRRPYVVKKTIQHKQKALGYFETFADAMAYLVEYNRDPALLSPSKTTFSEVYALWKAQHFPRLRSEAARISYRNSYRHCSRLHQMIFVDIRLVHLDLVIDDVRRSGCGYPTQKKVRSLLEQLYKYALRYDIVVKDYARYLDIDRPKKLHKKKPFTLRQRNKLWRGVSEIPETRHVLMLIYSGCRVGEYRHIRKTDVKLRRRIIVIRHSKTDAGAGRLVPIPKRLIPWYENAMQTPGLYICGRADGSRHSYDSFRRAIFDPVMRHFGMIHTPHECRHTLASMLDSADVNRTVIKLILGHSLEGVTERVYTHKSVRELLRAIDKVCT